MSGKVIINHQKLFILELMKGEKFIIIRNATEDRNSAPRRFEMSTLFRCLALSALIGFSAQAGSMNELDYQGKVLLNDIPFTGNGIFKFAISDAGNSTNYWANDGTGIGEPSGSITNPVWNGLFSVILGASPMTQINPNTFSSTNSRYLRVWFSSGAGFSEMLPSQKVVGGAYSVNSVLLGGQSASSIQSNAVSQATNSITLAGDITGLPHANSIAPGVIVDTDVNAAAAIAGTKIVQATTAVRGTVQLATGSTGTTAIAAGHPFLNAFSAVNTIAATGPNSGFGIVGAGGITVGVSGTNVVVGDTPIPNLDNTIWVAMNGTPVGPGTVDRPFDTPQAGYNAAAAMFPGTPSTVVIAGGDYASAGFGITMSSGTVHVLGLHRPRFSFIDVTAPGSMLALGGYQNVEGIISEAGSVIFATGGSVRFHNCKFNNMISIRGMRVIFQDCRLSSSDGSPALAIATAAGQTASFVGVYQSSLENRSPGAGTIEIGYPGMEFPNVQNLEVIGCEIVNKNGSEGGPIGTPGPAVQDWSPGHGPGFPAKLFAHNYIKGPLGDSEAGFAPPTIADPGVPALGYIPPLGPFLAIYNNNIQGSCGLAPVAAHGQFYANNTVVAGIINNVGGPVGWLQAGAGAGADAAGNVEHELAYPFPLPDNWDD